MNWQRSFSAQWKRLAWIRDSDPKLLPDFVGEKMARKGTFVADFSNEKRKEVKDMKEFELKLNLAGPGWENLLPTEISRITGMVIQQLTRANAAGGKVESAEVTFDGKHTSVPVAEFATA